MRFQYTINHVLEKTLYTADTLLRAPLKDTSEASGHTSSDKIERFVQAVIAALPADKDRLDSYRKAQAVYSICSKLIEYCKSRWPVRNQLSQDLKEYWRFHGELTLSDALLLCQSRIVIPASLQKVKIGKTHHGDQGIQRCRMHAYFLVWWPGVVKEMERFVQSCCICQKTTPPTREPMIIHL